MNRELQTVGLVLVLTLFVVAITVGIWYVEGELDFWLATIFGG